MTDDASSLPMDGLPAARPTDDPDALEVPAWPSQVWRRPQRDSDGTSDDDAEAHDGGQAPDVGFARVGALRPDESVGRGLALKPDPRIARDEVPAPDGERTPDGAVTDDEPPQPTTVAAIRRRIRPWRSTLIGFALAIATVIALVRIGFVDDYGNTLQVMGFDPDRAVLLTSLLLGAIAAVLVALVGGWFSAAVLTGFGVVLVAFYPVFREETRAAMGSAGADGIFDPVGWGLSALTLVVFGLVTGWAAAVLGRDVSSRLAIVGQAIGHLGARRPGAARATAPVLSAVVVVGLLAVTFPIFGDMLNFEPDAHMRQGAPAGVGLTGEGSGAGTSGTPTSVGPRRSADVVGPLVIPRNLVPGPVSGSYVTAGALASGQPWSAKPPAGDGRTVSIKLPAPWTGGIRDYATIDVYLPPGYDSGTKRYPVIYEPHQPLWAWEQGMHVVSFLDSLITSGEFPPQIVVFVGQFGGPYADSQCADSYDGKEWFDRYLGEDVPAYVDANFRTIKSVAARSLLGFSSGGYCAAAAITHHPDVFGTAMVFSGYFEAGIKTPTTPTAGRPFNNDPKIIAKVSPIKVVPRLTEAERSKMFFTFSADPDNHFYGDQITAFADVLDANQVAFAILPTPLGHSWSAVREQLPSVLSLLAARQLQLGVFKGS